MPGSGRARAEPRCRSKMTAAGTMGIRLRPAGKPTPRASRNCMTPAAASRPKALPPVRKMAWTQSTRCPGRQGVRSRVPAAEPRMSTPHTAPRSQRTTVQPVRPRKSLAWPMRIPGSVVAGPFTLTTGTVCSADFRQPARDGQTGRSRQKGSASSGVEESFTTNFSQST